ncbi:MAG: hypothetical protein ACXVGB_00280 [Mycobacteriaceae bacterium]
MDEVRAVSTRFVSLSEVVAFVERTNGHGVPMRIAIDRAVNRYGVERDLIKAFIEPHR